MTARRKFAWGVLFTVLLSLGAAQAEVVDRLIAVVNKHPVTWSDLDGQMRFEAFEERRALSALSAADRHAAFEHLVQACILRDQMQGTAPAREDEIDARIGELRAAWQMEKDDSGWRATMVRYGIGGAELRRLVAGQIETLKFIEFRVRPLVRVSREEVDQYYTQQLVPQVVAQGNKPEPEETLVHQIRELLAEQKMNQEIDKWLQSLRAQSSVQVLWSEAK